MNMVTTDMRELIGLVGTRYGLVVAAAKRARMLVDGDEPLVEILNPAEKPVTTAIRELHAGKVLATEDIK